VQAIPTLLRAANAVVGVSAPESKSSAAALESKEKDGGKAQLAFYLARCAAGRFLPRFSALCHGLCMSLLAPSLLGSC
jgi:hypothetical protein